MAESVASTWRGKVEDSFGVRSSVIGGCLLHCVACFGRIALMGKGSMGTIRSHSGQGGLDFELRSPVTLCVEFDIVSVSISRATAIL